MNDNNRIQNDVSKLYTKYGVNPSSKTLGEQKTKDVLVLAINDYFTKKINARELESLGTQLYYKLNNTSEINSKWNSSTANILQRLTDFAYYVENSNKDFVCEIKEELKKFENMFK